MDPQQFARKYDRIRLLEECERSCAALANYFGIRLRHVETAINRSRPWMRPTAVLQRLTITFVLQYQRLLDNQWTNAALDEAFKHLLRVIARTASLPESTLDPLKTVVKWLPPAAGYRLSVFLEEKRSQWRRNEIEADTCRELMDRFWREFLSFRLKLRRLRARFAREVWS